MIDDIYNIFHIFPDNEYKVIEQRKTEAYVIKIFVTVFSWEF